jgi:hypothetical protein
VSGIDQIAEILPGAKSRIDIEKILNSVSMIGFEIASLFPRRIEPKSCDTQTLQIIKFRDDPLDVSADETIAGGHPSALVISFELLRVIAIELGALTFPTVAESIGQKLIKNLVLPALR